MKQLITFLIILVVTVGVLSIEACKKKDTSPPATPINFVTPAGWPAPQYDFSSNPITQEGFELGRKLFYDGRLSKDGNYPCSSCHQSIAAFGTYDHDLSHGYNHSHTMRNAPGMFNLAWRNIFTYDGGMTNLEQQTISHITSPIDMGETLTGVIDKLKGDAIYRSMFKAAFGDETINTERLTKALSQFTLMLVSSNSRYDKMKRGEYTFNLPESLGYDIFKNKCATCHTEPFFSDFSFRNTGLPVNPLINDYGRMMITRNSIDSLKFQVPSLRNVQLTYPYGHDGRFLDIDQVLEHYRSGVVNGPTTDPLVRNRIALSNFEIGQLKAFLYTLTDSAFIANPAFRHP